MSESASSYRRQALTRQLLSFPPDAGAVVKQYRPSDALFKAAEVEEIIDAIEGDEYGVDNRHIYDRFEQNAVLILCSIFMYSEWCTAKARGLCIIAASATILREERLLAHPILQESIHIRQIDDVRLADQKYRTKIELGLWALPYLIKSLLKFAYTEETRRWVRKVPLDHRNDADRGHNRWEYLV